MDKDLKTYLDKRFQTIDTNLKTASAERQTIAAQVKRNTDTIEKNRTGIQVIREQMVTENQFNSLQDSVDQVATTLDTYRAEQAANLGAHYTYERWFKQIAKKLKIKLT